jgi:hypothetical protein
MPKRSSKPRDLAQMAKAIVDQATDPDDHGDDPYEGKDPLAVERGRLGGKRGGKVRAERLTAEQRSAAAREAVIARWGQRDKDQEVPTSSVPG